MDVACRHRGMHKCMEACTHAHMHYMHVGLYACIRAKLCRSLMSKQLSFVLKFYQMHKSIPLINGIAPNSDETQGFL